MTLLYSIPETTQVQYILSVFVVIGLFVLFALIKYRSDYWQLSPDQRSHKAAILEGRAAIDQRTERFAAGAIRRETADLRARVDALVTSAGNPVDVPTTTREGVAELRRAIRVSLRATVGRIPERALAAGEWALILAGLAIPVVVTEMLRRAVADSPDYPTLESVASDAASVIQTSVDIAVSVVTLFPRSESLYAMAVLIGMEGGGWLYAHWYVLAIALLTLAIVGWLAGRAGYDVGVTVVPTRRHWLAWVVGGVLAVWATGAIPAYLGQELGYSSVGSGIGLVLAFLVGVYLAFVGANRYVAGLVRAARPAWNEPPDRWQIGAFAVGKTITVLLWLAIPTALAYGVVGLVSGDYVSLLAAVLTAPLDVQLALLLGTLLVTLVVGVVLDEVGTTARTVIQEVGARKAIRLTALRQGFPAVGTALAFLLLQHVLGNVITAGIGAVAVGVGLRIVYGLVTRARYRARLWSESERRPRRVVIQVWEVPDGDGTSRWLADVEGERLAAPDPGQLVDAVCAVARDIADDGTASRRLEHAYHQAMCEFGLVDFDDVVQKERERARKQLLAPLRGADDYQLPRDEYEPEIDGLPQAAVEQQRNYIEELDVIREGRETVTYRPQADPWRSHSS